MTKCLFITAVLFLLMSWSVQEIIVIGERPQVSLDELYLQYQYPGPNVTVVPAYADYVETDVEYTNDALKKLFDFYKNNVNELGSVGTDETTVIVDYGDLLHDNLHMTKLVVTGLNTTVFERLTLMTNYKRDRKRVDGLVYIPNVGIYTTYNSEFANAHGTVKLHINGIMAYVTAQLDSFSRNSNNNPVYEVTALFSNATLGPMTIEVETEPADLAIETNRPLLQFGINIVKDSVAKAVGDYLVKIFNQYINEIIPEYPSKS